MEDNFKQFMLVGKIVFSWMILLFINFGILFLSLSQMKINFLLIIDFSLSPIFVGYFVNLLIQNTDLNKKDFFFYGVKLPIIILYILEGIAIYIFSNISFGGGLFV
jgi:hypothetical protein